MALQQYRGKLPGNLWKSIKSKWENNGKSWFWRIKRYLSTDSFRQVLDELHELCGSQLHWKRGRTGNLTPISKNPNHYANFIENPFELWINSYTQCIASTFEWKHLFDQVLCWASNSVGKQRSYISSSSNQEQANEGGLWSFIRRTGGAVCI